VKQHILSLEEDNLESLAILYISFNFKDTWEIYQFYLFSYQTIELSTEFSLLATEITFSNVIGFPNKK